MNLVKGMWRVPSVLVCLFSASCSAQMEELRTANKTLGDKVRQQQQNIVQLTDKLDATTAHANVLGLEKGYRDESLRKVRDVTRNHVRNQFDALNALARNEDLLDFVGGELIARTKDDDSKKRTLLYSVPMAGNATIYKFKSLPLRNTSLALGVYKKIEDGYLCVMSSDPFMVEATNGIVTVELETPLYMQAGDYFGFTFSEAVALPYDDQTGKYVLFGKPTQLGDRITKGPEAESRNYSIGIYGIVEKPTQ